MKSDIFATELNRIQNEAVRKSAIYLLEQLPEYFYHVPASSSGKHHPDFSLGEGGLVRHVKVACRIAEELFRNKVYGTYSDYEKDLIRTAVLLHDGLKNGLEDCGHTVIEHPLLMVDFLYNNINNLDIPIEDIQTIARLISTHMGPWTQNQEGKDILRAPQSLDEILVHTCDYFASRKVISVKFINNEIYEDDRKEYSGNKRVYDHDQFTKK